MPFTVLELVYGGLAPALGAGAIVWALYRGFPGAAGGQFAASAAFACGFFVGFRLLALDPWAPKYHWHWLPYAVLLAAVVGPIASSSGRPLTVRVVSYAMVAIASAWVLVPARENLEPSRLVYMIGWVVYVTSLAALLAPLPSRLPGPLFPAVLALALLTGGVVLLLAGSLRFAWYGVAAASAMAGVAIAAALDKRTGAIAGVALPYAVLNTGAMLAGRLNLTGYVPWISYLLVPLAPLLSWAVVRGRLSTWTGARRAFALAALPGLLLAVALLLAALA